MIDRDPWNQYNEGNLARQWEKKLRPRKQPKPKVQRKPWVRTVLWISALWGAGMIASILAIHVMVMGYQVDRLESQYTQLHRQQQVLSLTVTDLTSPRALAADASRLHLTMVVPKTQTPAPKRSVAHQVPRYATWPQLVSQWIIHLREAVTRA
ncbi:hypothetical protein [Sulfobacillus sp. hq2]|uniref:hypothetical protein n=1 Tax=Sulfobacillus TaxID=28033 RepID=UPI000CD111F1|nr:hypothetical protein [Sulfobacillus sp. hq2]POB09351.1 hypothetical protein CO251_13970 [Sulfobacillus sp. hq2]